MTADTVKTSWEVLPIQFDFSEWTAFEEYPITSADFTESDAGITISTPDIQDNIIKVFVSGGTVDTVYKIVCRALTANVVRAERTKSIAIVDEL